MSYVGSIVTKIIKILYRNFNKWVLYQIKLHITTNYNNVNIVKNWSTPLQIKNKSFYIICYNILTVNTYYNSCTVVRLYLTI